jgi:type VI secretion system protein ImpC
MEDTSVRPDSESRYRVVLEEEPEPSALALEDLPFRNAILGDFSGRTNRGLSATRDETAPWRPVAIDRDNFEDVMARLKPGLRIELGDAGPQIALAFGSLDDFHPDHLYEHLDIFAKLREIRRRLADPRTFTAAAAELQGTAGSRPAPEPPGASSGGQDDPPAKPSVNELISGNLLDQVLDETPSRPQGSARPDELRRFVQAVMAPHLVPGADPRQPELLAQVDRLTAEAMRAILHHADFQALESAWRGVDLLVRRLETDSNLKLFLIDVSKNELAADLGAGNDLTATATYQLLVEQTVGTPGAHPWALFVGNYYFRATRDDLAVLAQIARVAAAAGAPFLAAAHSNLLGCESLAATPHSREWGGISDPLAAQRWRELRMKPAADHLGLALPRFLLRLPYGRATQPCEQFDFEEFETTPSHEHYLWGNPAFICALLLGEDFNRSGWEMQPRGGEVGNLPLHIYTEGGESIAKPRAEALLTEAAVERILDEGLMPLVSLKGQDAVRLVRFQSIASPVRALAGRWQ